MTIINLHDWRNGSPVNNLDSILTVEETQARELDSLFGSIKQISSLFDPKFMSNPFMQSVFAFEDDSLNYSILTYMDPNDKEKVIEYFLERLPDHLGVLIEVKKSKDREHFDGYSSTAYFSGSTFLLDKETGCRGFSKKVVSPKVFKEEMIEEAISLGYGDCYSEQYASMLMNNPIISSLLGLTKVEDYVQKVSLGKFPFILVDTNPENEVCDVAGIKELWQDDSKKLQAYSNFFYMANENYLKDLDILIRKYAVPVIFLSSKDETRGILDMLPHFYNSASTRSCFGKGRNKPGWLAKR